MAGQKLLKLISPQSIFPDFLLLHQPDTCALLMNQHKYTHIFFDLDHTLWDFDANNLLTFDEILNSHKLYSPSIIPDLATFMAVYALHNKNLWDQYKQGLIEKSFLSYQRFKLTLQHFKIDDINMAKSMAENYIRISPTKTLLRDGAIEILEWLKPKYTLGLITNGFDEIQFVKIRNSGLDEFFSIVVTSEEAGFKKPDPGIFYYSLKKAGATANLSLYIGDEPETDIVGAKAAGIDQVLVAFGHDFNHIGASYLVHELLDLKKIL